MSGRPQRYIPPRPMRRPSLPQGTPASDTAQATSVPSTGGALDAAVGSACDLLIHAVDSGARSVLATQGVATFDAGPPGLVFVVGSFQGVVGTRITTPAGGPATLIPSTPSAGDVLPHWRAILAALARPGVDLARVARLLDAGGPFGAASVADEPKGPIQ